MTKYYFQKLYQEIIFDKVKVCTKIKFLPKLFVFRDSRSRDQVI